jgi:hypothetical protein
MDSNAVRYGLFAGLGTIVVMLLLYMVNAEMLFGWALQATWLIYLFCMYKAVDDLKNDNGGFISLREGFTAAFIVFAIANLMYIVFYYVLVNVIDPSLMDIQIQKGIETVEKVAEFAGMSEEELDAAVEEIEKGMEPDLGQTALGYAISLVFGAIPAVIVAAILKKERPMHLQQNDEILDTEV